MKFIFRKISFAWVFLVTLFIPGSSKAASKKDITQRINKVREIINTLPATNNSIKLTGDEFAGKTEDDLNKWVNWGNWANWNNWNNWSNWAKWGDWGNWRNY